MKKEFTSTFEHITSPENLFSAWQEFTKGKRSKSDVLAFTANLSSNVFNLHTDLVTMAYRHGGYYAFNISDPKPRNIHKASVRDRLVHHAIYRVLYPLYDGTFLNDSYSCRNGKGVHKAIARFQMFARQVSRNNTHTGYVLKCDIRKFFANIDHMILLDVLRKSIKDEKTIWLLENIVCSFYAATPGVGLPLGNLTSQLLVNVYMNEFDQFAKHKLKAQRYIRYADDFAFLDDDKETLELLIPQIENFLWRHLRLTLHPDKLYIKTVSSGVDFLGWVHFPTHTVLRTTSKRRMFAKLKENQSPNVLQSYVGLLSHGDTYKLHNKILKQNPRSS